MAQEGKIEAEMKGQERVYCSPVKHISVLLTEGSAGKTIAWTFLKHRWGEKTQRMNFNSVLAVQL